MPWCPSLAVVVALLGLSAAERRALRRSPRAPPGRPARPLVGAGRSGRDAGESVEHRQRLGQAGARAGARGQHRPRPTAASVRAGEANSWRDQRDDGSDDFVLTLGLGLGARFDYAGGRLRSSVAAGGTLLAVPADVDKAGTLGAFADVRPLGFVWPLGHRRADRGRSALADAGGPGGDRHPPGLDPVPHHDLCRA